MENFHSAYAQANLLYGLELTPEEFEEIGLIAWNKIGNRQTKLYRYRCKIDCETLTVELPCNCDFVEAVTYDLKTGNILPMTQLMGIINLSLLRTI